MSDSNRPLLGASLVALAVLMFTIMDVIGKQLTLTYPVEMVVGARYGLGLILLFVLVWPRVGARLWQAQKFWQQLLRGSFLSFGSVTAAHAFRLMPLAESMAIIFLTPIIVLIFAKPLLGERVTPLAWFLTILGFAGVLLVLRPGGGLDPLGVSFALACACCASAYHIMTRKA